MSRASIESSTPSSRDSTWNGKPAPSTYLHKQLDVTASLTGFDYRSPVGENCIATSLLTWACGAVGSALPWHGRGRRFEPDQVHQIDPEIHCCVLRADG